MAKSRLGVRVRDGVNRLAEDGPVPRTCRFPLWPDGEKPNGHYCGRLVKPRSSYCADHHKVCYTGTTWNKRGRGMSLSMLPPPLQKEPKMVKMDAIVRGKLREQIIDLINQGCDNQQIIDRVETTAPYIRAVRSRHNRGVST